MKSLPLQMQQNLILAATLLGGVLLTPPLPTHLRANSLERASHAAPTAESNRPIARKIPVSKLSHAAFVTNVPREVQGAWIGSTVESENENESTRFEFHPDGHYSYTYSLRQHRYGMVRAVEAITVEAGTVSFRKDGTFVMQPEKGHFQGNIRGGYMSRPMESEELGTRIFRWEWRGTREKPRLYLGPDARSAHAFTGASAA